MKESEIKILSTLKLTRPTFILGLYDRHNIAAVIVQALIEHTRSEKFAELYSPYFPDYIISGETGILNLPRYDFYASKLFDPNIVIMTGDIRPDPENSQAYYEIFSLVLNFARTLGSRRFISFGIFQGEDAENKIHIAATSKRLVSLLTRKLEAEPFASGGIDGLQGILLGLAKTQRIPAICILGPISRNLSQQDLAENVLHFVLEALKSTAW